MNPVSGHPELLKSTQGSFVVNNDTAAYKDFLERHGKLTSKESRIVSLESKLNNIEQLLMKMMEKMA